MHLSTSCFKATPFCQDNLNNKQQDLIRLAYPTDKDATGIHSPRATLIHLEADVTVMFTQWRCKSPEDNTKSIFINRYAYS